MGSNALAFKTWASNEKVVNNSPTEQFRNARVGIDAEDYLHSLLITGNREPLLPALGGKPFCLWRRVDDDLEGYKAAGIEPWFVFNGLDLACRDRVSLQNESTKASHFLNEAWSIYDQGRGEDAVITFGKACTYRIYQVARSLFMRLRSKGVRVHTAPYSAAAQLVQMKREENIAAIQGSASCLLFNADQIILNFDWDKQSAVWVTLQRCLSKLDVPREHFVNACLLSGWSILETLPELETENSVSKLQAANTLLKGVHYDVDGLLRQKYAHYYDRFNKARAALRHPVVTTEKGEVKPLNFQAGPADVHEFTGHRLPDELYFYLSRGLAGPRILNWRTRLEIVETPPLDGGNSTAYKDLVQTKILPLRTQAIALMTKSLNRYYQKQEVKLTGWWAGSPSTPTFLGTVDATDPTTTADKWLVRSAQLAQLSSADDSSSILTWAVDALATESEAKKTVASHAPTTENITEVREIRINTVWRFLQGRGYITSEHTLTAWGKALRAALNHSSSHLDDMPPATATELEEAIFMAFEMLRLGLLDRKQMFPVPPYTGGPIRGTEDDKAEIGLISRVACLGFLRHKSIGYTGPLSRILLAYHQCVAVVRGALRDLLEMHACHLLMSNAVVRTMDGTVYTDVAASLPLVEEPDLGLALIVKCYLDELCQTPDRRVAISGWFPHAEDIEGDLQKAWKLWEAILAGVQAADRSIVNADTKHTFKAADDWLKTKLSQNSLPNGVPAAIGNTAANIAAGAHAAANPPA